MAHHKSGHNNYKSSLPMIGKVQWGEGYVGPKFKKNHNLSNSAIPEDYAETFLPLSRNVQGNKEMMIFEQMTKWKNLKASISGAGQGGTCYPNFRPLTVR